MLSTGFVFQVTGLKINPRFVVNENGFGRMFSNRKETTRGLGNWGKPFSVNNDQ